ncbi:MAG: hypothetical protein V7K47_11360 [Nostoc sp.]
MNLIQAIALCIQRRFWCVSAAHRRHRLLVMGLRGTIALSTQLRCGTLV